MKIGKYKKVLGCNVQSKTAPFWLKTAYRIWMAQRNRCNNKKNPKYPNYGAKGIKVQYDFLQFVEWFLENLTDEHKKYRKTGRYIHVGRINHSKNYTLKNIEIVKDYQNSQEVIQRLGTPISRVPVIEYWKKSNKLKAEYPSIKAAAAANGLTHAQVWSYLNSGRNTLRKRTYFVRA